MTNNQSYEFTPYGLTTWYYEDETVFDVTDDNGNTVPMRLPEFTVKHADNRAPSPGGGRL